MSMLSHSASSSPTPIWGNESRAYFFLCLLDAKLLNISHNEKKERKRKAKKKKEKVANTKAEKMHGK